MLGGDSQLAPVPSGPLIAQRGYDSEGESHRHPAAEMTGLAFAHSYGGAGHNSPWWLVLAAFGVVLIVNVDRWLRRRNRL
jgi:hypothetical protein